MKLSRTAFCLALIWLFSLNVLALPASDSIEEIYKKGMKRAYTFLVSGEPFGRFEVEYGGRVHFEGIPGYLFRENLALDFTPLGQDYKLTITNKHYVDEINRYIGDDMNFYINDEFQKLFLKKDEVALSGYAVRNNQSEDLSLPQRDVFSSLDNNMLSQIELFLAFQNLIVGGNVVDTVFIPQTLLMSPVEFSVEKFQWARYGDLYDSAYVCRFTRPIDMTAYVTKDKKLIRLDRENQNIQIFLEETPFDRAAPKIKAFSLSDFFPRLPLYVVYLIFGGLFAYPMVRKYYKQYPVYIALILGILAYLIVREILYPVQKWYSLKYMIPGLQTGQSLYILAILPALISGLLQELFKLIPVILVYLWKRPTRNYSITLGIMCAVGFGIYEASAITGPAFQAGNFSLFSWHVCERIVMILFHVVSGAAFGYGLNRGWKYLLYFWLIISMIHWISDYLLVFLQKNIIDIGLLVIIKLLIYLFLLLGTYLTIRNSRR